MSIKVLNCLLDMCFLTSLERLETLDQLIKLLKLLITGPFLIIFLFFDEDLEALKQILPTATSVLKYWSLNVKEQKTEFVRVYLAGKNETDSFGAEIAGNEPWRSTKLLGSLLCST